MTPAPEHNPDGLTPEQYGAPEWRLLRKGERQQSGDEWTQDFDVVWYPILPEMQGCCIFSTITYRRRVTPDPTPEQDLKGGDEPCPQCAQPAEAITSSDSRAVGRNAPVAVQSGDQGQATEQREKWIPDTDPDGKPYVHKPDESTKPRGIEDPNFEEPEYTRLKAQKDAMEAADRAKRFPELAKNYTDALSCIDRKNERIAELEREKSEMEKAKNHSNASLNIAENRVRLLEGQLEAARINAVVHKDRLLDEIRTLRAENARLAEENARLATDLAAAKSDGVRLSASLKNTQDARDSNAMSVKIIQANRDEWEKSWGNMAAAGGRLAAENAELRKKLNQYE